jgi:hypothetical protein
MVLTTPTHFLANVADTLDEITKQATPAAQFHNGAMRPASSLAYVSRYVRNKVAGAQPTTHPKCEAKEHEDHPIVDPAFFALYAATGSVYTIAPNGLQARFLAKLALDFGGYVDPTVIVQTLACLALRDRDDQLKQATATVAGERERLTTRIAELEPLEHQLTTAQQRCKALDEQVASLTTQLKHSATALANERERVALLWGTLDDERPDSILAAPAPIEPIAAAPRRTKLPGETGIYLGDSGKYQIGYKAGVGGPQRWETIDGDLDEARRIRAQRIDDAKAVTA